MIIETERLLMRPYTLDDIEAAFQVNLDKAVSKYTGDGGVKTRKEIQQIIESTTMADYEKYGFGRLAVIYKPDNKYIGFSGLKYLPEFDMVDIGYRFASAYWGMGIATESARPFIPYGFEHLNLREIVGFVMPENKASANVLKKLGFHLEGLFDYDGEMVEKYIIVRGSE
jgi:ribosomal-protein-alanine N-acetyltransferase